MAEAACRFRFEEAQTDSPVRANGVQRNRGRLREGAESYAKALASDILR